MTAPTSPGATSPVPPSSRPTPGHPSAIGDLGHRGRKQLTFTFDQSRCTGCKACQIACKDKNDLPVGVTWRRVYESCGGAWPEADGLVASGVFTYYTSVSCNHCTDPICVSVCPSTAMRKGEAGVVVVDPAVCIGCGYCAMACPYEAPQYRAEQGIMTKCDGCPDRIAEGLAPACVAACPTRALGHLLTSAPAPTSRQPEPLPDPALTRPNLIVGPHPRAVAVSPADVQTSPRTEPGLGHEAPLAVFTVLAQSAAGLTAALSLTMAWSSVVRGQHLGSLPLLVTVVAGLMLGLALAASAAHLGRPLRALNSLRNLRSSWLSREIVAATVFGGSLLALGGVLVVLPDEPVAQVVVAGLSGTAGLVLVWIIGRVYTLPTVPAWDSSHTTVAFFVTAGSVGSALLAVLIGLGGSPASSAQAQLPLYLLSAGILAAGRWARGRHQAGLAWGSPAARLSGSILASAHPGLRSLGRWSAVSGVTAGIAAGAGPFGPSASATLGVAAVLLVATSELVTRLLFYRSMIRDGR